MKILLITGIICNFISIQSNTLGSCKHKDIFRILVNVETNVFKIINKFKKILQIFEQLWKLFWQFWFEKYLKNLRNF